MHHNCNTCSILTLHHSNIPSHYSAFIHLQTHSGFQLPHLPSTFVSLAHFCFCNYICNVEINPGPRPIDQNPVFCSICSNKISQWVQQDMAPSCSDENCNARCHQACNGLSISQTCHVKNSGCTITWKCPQHGIGTADIAVSPAPVDELPNRPSAVGKSCSVCKHPTSTRYADLAYHWANPSSNHACHLAATNNGFVNPRGTSRACALSTRVWHCHLHYSPSATTHPSSPLDNSPPCPTPPSLKSLLNQGLSLADAKNPKEKCAKCSAALCSNYVPVRCSGCSKGFHQKCSTCPKASTRDNL